MSQSVKFVLSVTVSVLATLSGCAATEPADPAMAQSTAQQAWQQAQHGIWELNWEQMPLSGPVIFEAWIAEERTQRRFEILEAPAPDLVGLVYVSDGERAQITNRLEPIAPVIGPASLPFSPVSDAFEAVTLFPVNPVQSAQQQRRGSESVVEFIFTDVAGQTMSIRLDTRTNLIIKVELTGPDVNLTLNSRSLEPLSDPHPDLFTLTAE